MILREVVPSSCHREGVPGSKSPVPQRSLPPARRIFAGALMTVCLFVTPAAGAGTYYPPPESQGGWRTLVTKNAVPTAEQKSAVRNTAGLDTDRLVEAWNYTQSLGQRQSLLVIRHGWIVGEWDYVGTGPVNSATKSLTGLALAKLFELSDAGRLPRTIGYDDFVYRYQTARTGNLEQVLSECPEFCSTLLAKVMAAVVEKTFAAQPGRGREAHTTLPSSYRIEQITTGPYHHFYGYQGHAGNTPFNASGTHLVLLETAFQDRLVEKTDSADIVLVDLATKSKTTLTQTRAWNFQQGTMMYWNPLAPDDEIIFNDRDARTDKVKTVLFNVKTKRRVKEWSFSATPFGNSGMAQRGGEFLGINYGRLDRLRRITGYAGAYDWTAGVRCPANDGIWLVDTVTGAEKLLLSFEQLRDLFVAQTPDIGKYDLFINHTLWNRDDTRFLAAVRWFDSKHTLRSIWFTCRSDGTDVTAFTTDPGHPDWDAGTNLMTGHGVVYETRTARLVETIDKAFFTYDGDLSISRDQNWLASNDFRLNPDKKTQDVRVLIYSRAAQAGLRLPWYSRGVYFWNNAEDYCDDNRIDVSPCWSRDATEIYFFALADDGTRQAFVVHLGWDSPTQ
jgi:hypothetical protein